MIKVNLSPQPAEAKARKQPNASSPANSDYPIAAIAKLDEPVSFPPADWQAENQAPKIQEENQTNFLSRLEQYALLTKPCFQDHQAIGRQATSHSIWPNVRPH